MQDLQLLTRDQQTPFVFQDQQYLVCEGKIQRFKQTSAGPKLVPLCNFDARIVEEVTHDDGADQTRVLSIEGRLANSFSLLRAQVDALELPSMKWVLSQWGSRAIVEAGSSSNDHLRAAIQYLSTRVETRYIYTHTGWTEIEGHPVFLTRAGGIGSYTAEVELEHELERYNLPAPSEPLAGMVTSLRFLDVAPHRVTIPLWAAMYLAPLASLVPLKFMLWVYGMTGVLKSTLAALALSHYGDFTENDLIQWSATSNALEKYLFLAKDVPFIVDDFAPQADRVSAQRLEDTAARLVRHVGNQSGRARMRSDLTLRSVYRPRGLVIATGEQLPDGQSLLARLVTVPIQRGDVNLDRLSAAQTDRDLYPEAMAGYIQWLAGRWDRLKETVPEWVQTYRARFRREGQHLRLPEALALLYLGLDLAAEYALAVGAFDQDARAELLMAGWKALCEIGQEQHNVNEQERPTLRFLGVLSDLLTQNKVQLLRIDGEGATGLGDLVGWYDAGHIYLLPGAAYHRVAQFMREEGKHFALKEGALRKMLAEEGLLLPDEGRYSSTVWVNGQTRRVLKLARAGVEQALGTSMVRAEPGR